MEKYNIRLKGCDDETEFEMELTKDHFELLEKVAELSKKTSECDCMPILIIKKI